MSEDSNATSVIPQTLCDTEHAHVFVIARKDYYKKKHYDYGYDQSKSFSMLFCQRCGITTEIISANHEEVLK